MTNAVAYLTSGMARYRLTLFVAVFCILWSSAFSVAKIAITDCPPLLFLAARFSLAGIAMLLAADAFRQAMPSKRDIIALALLGVINNAGYLSLSYLGLGGVSAGLAALLISVNPILTAIAAIVLLGERMTSRKAAGLLIGFCGVAFVVQGRLYGGTDTANGLMLTAAALVTLVTGTVLFKILSPRGSLWVGSGVQNMAGGLAVLPFALGFESLSGINVSPSLLLALLYVSFGVSIVGLLVWFYLLTSFGPTIASSYHFLMPPLGILFGWLLLGERISLFDLAGVIPIAYGIYLVTRPAATTSAATPISRAGLSGAQPERPHAAALPRSEGNAATLVYCGESLTPRPNFRSKPALTACITKKL